MDQKKPWYLRSRTSYEKLSIVLHNMWGFLTSALGLRYESLATPTLAVRSWISYLHHQNLPQPQQRIAVMAMRNAIWFEWAMYACCWLRRLGYGPVMVYSRQDLERVYGNLAERKLRQFLLSGGIWREFQRLPDLELVAMEDTDTPSVQQERAYRGFAEDYTHTLTAYDLYVEEREQVARQREYLDTQHYYCKNLSSWGARFETLFRHLEEQYSIRRIVGFSGIIGLTAAANEAAKRLGWTRCWVESWGIRPGLMTWNENSPALFVPYKEWVDGFSHWNEKAETEIDSSLLFQQTGRSLDELQTAENSVMYQTASVNDPLPENVQTFISKDNRPIFLMGLNVVGDSATLRCCTIFDSQRQWTEEVVSFFRCQPQWRLIIRGHPGERFQTQVPVKISEVAANVAADAENIMVILSEMPCNTYSLIHYARVGLNWVSNFGVDCVLHDVPTISAARPCYTGLGITIEPSSKEKYFSLMERLLHEPRRTTEHMKLQAKKYLSVLYKHSALEAFGPRYRAAEIHLKHPVESSFGVFYRIIAGELPCITWFYRS